MKCGCKFNTVASKPIRNIDEKNGCTIGGFRRKQKPQYAHQNIRTYVHVKYGFFFRALDPGVDRVRTCTIVSEFDFQASI